ncbi:MAG: CHAT domain-containing protein [Candidatus Krumholzibacteriota bacterium]|nr:CHAT domain-containing protein [Candidatus Krumholzibacteriota bacterium]
MPFAKTFLLYFFLCLFIVYGSAPAKNETTEALLDRVDSLVLKGQIDSARTALEMAVSHALSVYGKSDSTIALRIWWKDEQSVPHYFRNHAQAESLITRVVKIKEKISGDNDPELSQMLQNLANCHMSKGEFDKAKVLSERTIQLRKEDSYRRHIDVGRALVNLAYIANKENRIGSADSLYKESISIFESELDPGSPLIPDVLGRYGYFNYSQGKYGKAEANFVKALELKVKHDESDYRNIALYYSMLGSVYRKIGKYSESEEMHRRAVELRRKEFGNEHELVAQSLSDLARICGFQTKLVEAELFYRESLAIREKLFGPEHPMVAASLNSMAWLYLIQRKLDDAERLYQRVLDIRKRSLGPEHPDVARAITGLAYVARYRGDYSKAEQLNRQALAIREKAQGLEHPNRVYNLSELAVVLQLQKKFGEAEKYLMEVVELREKSFGGNYPTLATDLNQLAFLYLRQGRDEEALTLQEKALSIVEKSFGEKHSTVALVHRSMCITLRQQERYVEAINHAEKDCLMWLEMFRENAMVLSEQDALTYSQTCSSAIDNYITCCADAGFDIMPGKRQLFDVLLSSKGQIADQMYERAQMATARDTDAITARLFESLRLTRFELANLFTLGAQNDPDSYRARLDSLSTDARELEAELLRQGIDKGKKREYEKINTQRIASLVPEGAALVEYIKYSYAPADLSDEIPRYLALLIAHGKPPRIFDIGQASELEPLITQYRQNIESTLGREPATFDKRIYEKLGQKLYARLWEPVEKQLGDDTTVLISPDGALNLVSFAGLVDRSGSYLIEHRPLHYLSSARDLTRLNGRKTNQAKGLLALGDPDFGSPANKLPQPSKHDSIGQTGPVIVASRDARSFTGDFNSIDLSPLPASRNEIEAIVKKWKKMTDEEAKVHFGLDASEERFKAEASGTRVIHLATHGYFLKHESLRGEHGENSRSEAAVIGENPLLQSGLFLAGAKLRKEDGKNTGAEDGILTAYEVSTLDLRGVELVVLSACETGLGEVKEGEGVYGLRRAFQMAGAGTVISSLWPVSDQATAEIMSNLYGRRDDTMPVIIRNAQLKKLREIRSAGRVDHPATWGAFIAIGDWR